MELTGEKSSRRWCGLLAAGLASVSGAAQAGLIATGTSEGYLDAREGVRIAYADVPESVTVRIGGEGASELWVNGERVMTAAAGESKSYVLAASETAYRLECRSGDDVQCVYMTVLPDHNAKSVVARAKSQEDFVDSRPEGTVRVLPSRWATMSVAYSALWNAAATGARVRVFDKDGNELAANPLVDAGAGEEGVAGFTPNDVSEDGFRFKLTHEDGVATLVAFVRAKGSGKLLTIR